MNWEYPDLLTEVKLPGVVETWTSYLSNGGELTGLVITSVVLALVAVFLFFLHRSNVLITFSRLIAEDARSPSKHSLIISGMIPTLSICFMCCSAFVPRSNLLLLSLSNISRVAGCYLVLVGCIRMCGGQVCVFKLTRLTLNSTRSIREYKRSHSNLSLSVTLLTVEVFLICTLHLTILLLSYNTSQPLYPHNILHTDTLILCYYSGVIVAAVLGVVAACKVVGEMSKPMRVPVLVKVVSLAMVVGEMVMTLSVTGDRGDKWRDSAVVFLTRNCLMTVLVQSFELIVIIILNKRLLNRAKLTVQSAVIEEEEVSKGLALHDKFQLRLNREDSVELLRALNLHESSFRFDEGIKVLLSTNSHDDAKTHFHLLLRFVRELIEVF